VADRGVGVAPADRERVFERYFRCDTGNLHDVKGFGLGLSYVRLMAEAQVNQNACCPGAAATAIEAGRCLGASEAESIGYATSHDRSPGESFVGYVGIVF
jgi:hypothetical protein